MRSVSRRVFDMFVAVDQIMVLLEFAGPDQIWTPRCIVFFFPTTTISFRKPTVSCSKSYTWGPFGKNTKIVIPFMRNQLQTIFIAAVLTNCCESCPRFNGCFCQCPPTILIWIIWLAKPTPHGLFTSTTRPVSSCSSPSFHLPCSEKLPQKPPGARPNETLPVSSSSSTCNSGRSPF